MTTRQKLRQFSSYLGGGVVLVLVVAGFLIYSSWTAISFNTQNHAELASLSASAPSKKGEVENCTAKQRNADSAAKILAGNRAEYAIRQRMTEHVQSYEAIRITCEQVVPEYDRTYRRLVELTAAVRDEKRSKLDKLLDGELPEVENYEFKRAYQPCFAGLCREPL